MFDCGVEKIVSEKFLKEFDQFDTFDLLLELRMKIKDECPEHAKPG